jgi:hypothetical protein
MLLKKLSLVALACAGCNALLGLEDGILADEHCDPSSAVACYSGPELTAGVGACRAGLKRCNATGDGYGACEGEVTPAHERCGNGIDDDCDGAVDEEADGCACVPGSIEACAYGGPEETRDVGACRAGQRICSKDSRWGPCSDEVAPREEDCATHADEDCDGSEGCGVTISGALAGGRGAQAARAIAADPWGGAFVGGDFTGSLDLGAMGGAPPIATAASQDVFVAQVDAGGAVTWAQRLVDSGEASLRAIATAPRAGATDAPGTVALAVVGELHGQIDLPGESGTLELVATEPSGFVIELSARGLARWGTVLPGRPRDVAITPDGEIVVASAVGSDVEIAWYLAETRLHASVLGGTGEQEPTAIAVDAAGQVVVAGTFEQVLELCDEAKVAAGMRDIFVARLDRHGGCVRYSTFGDAADQRSGDIAVAPSGELALSGAFEGTVDLGGVSVHADRPSVFVAELGAGGEHLFHRAFPGETPPRVALDAAGGLLFAGDVEGPIDLGGETIGAARGGLDVIVARLDPSGQHVWSRRLGAGPGASGGVRSTAGLAVAAGRGEVLLAADIDGSVDFGGGSTPSRDGDLLLLRLAR